MVFCRFIGTDGICDLTPGELARLQKLRSDAHVAQLVERVLGKDEVISSILIMGSILVFGEPALDT